jgi:uncharacterized membrane protein
VVNNRDSLLAWAEERRIADVPRALCVAGVTPDGTAWVRFAAVLTLWLGVVLLAASVVFFIAYNWDALGRFGKFALVEVLWLCAVVGAFRAGIDHAPGKASLLAAALLTGALLALIGQTYQTGADTYELFAVWAALILPWVLVARFAPLWMVWLALVNLSITLYFQAFRGMIDVLLGPPSLLWALAGVNTFSLAVWEWRARSGLAWMHERWPARVLVTAAGTCMLFIALNAILEFRQSGPLGLVGYVLWTAAVGYYYRVRLKDVYALAGVVLSAICVIAAGLSKHLITRHDAGAFLLIGLIVIGLSAAGAWWLRRIAGEAE